MDYERLDVYRAAMLFAALSHAIQRALPRGQSDLADQLRRATNSIPLNIAEGSGKTTPRDRARYHAAARGSAMECAAIIELLLVQSSIDADTAAKAKSLTVRLVAMLSKMSR
jgi:four helix bundle protein